VAIEKLKLKDIKAAQPRSKSYSLPDGGGLSLFVHPNGSKQWRYRYRFHGTAKTLCFNLWPTVSLDSARQQHRKARLALVNWEN
jgi:hypothetical protein